MLPSLSRCVCACLYVCIFDEENLVSLSPHQEKHGGFIAKESAQAVANAFAAVAMVQMAGASSSGSTSQAAQPKKIKPSKEVKDAKRLSGRWVANTGLLKESLGFVSKKRASGHVKGNSTCKEKDEKEEVKKEAAAREEPSETLKPQPESRIDVSMLRPKAGRTQHQWKDNHPAEWKAMIQQGELVPPSQNLLSLRQFASRKRKSESAQSSEKRLRSRHDDTNEKVYLQRQARWTKSQSLAKRDKEMSQPDVKVEPRAKVSPPGPSAGLVGGDVDIGNGLRSPKWLWQALYPYQHRCVQWLWGLHQEKMGGILADEMGLGKTIQIIAYLAVLHHSKVLQDMKVQNTSLCSASPPRTGGILIVCPATLINQWRNELHLWYPPLRVCVMHQINEAERREAIKQASSNQGILITSYETMRLSIDALLEATWVIVILDEGQKIRNPHASLTIACKRFSTAHRILLSGSPIQNNLRELWSLFDFVCPGRLGTLPVFTEEFAQPIENGNVMGATEPKVAAAYQCALALRGLTEPCILRRTKAECMDVLHLPAKQEQVLFCHLTPEQYQLYVQFLETEQVRRAKTVSSDRQVLGAVFFALSVLRKLCNHPDLLLKANEGEECEDLWNYDKSGKMRVLSEILKVWHKDRHRTLIFVQTVQMLEILELWMSRVGYTHFRIDGKTPVKRRLKLIEEFNENEEVFAMLLTTRVGGVGLNIIGADRVVIFDPDWNPMTDVQARERAWRIGQTREVSVYRLVLTGTVEEKIYHRQVYKHFLAQKVLQDPRQRRFFKWNDISDLFEVPPPPPNFTKQNMLTLQKKYRGLFNKVARMGEAFQPDEFEVETTEIMKAVSDLPMKEQHKTGRGTADESNAILQTLYDAQGIKASFNHDKVEQTLLDRKLVGKSAGLVAQKALDALKRSSRERAAHHVSEPTWTGQQGRAGAIFQTVKHVKQEAKKDMKGKDGKGNFLKSPKSPMDGQGRVSSSEILHGLRQLAALRGTSGTSTAEPSEPSEPSLFDSDRRIAEDILRAFLDKKLAPDHRLTTGQVLEKLAVQVAAHHNDLFKTLLKQMCILTKSSQKNVPGYWTLKEEFWKQPERL